jgi:hypothetical protein
VARATKVGFECHTSPHNQGADSLGGVELVAGHGQQVHPQGIPPHRHLADRLRRIGMPENIARVGDVGNRPQILERADFVVGVHDGDEDGLCGDRGCNFGWLDPTIPIDGQIGHVVALTLKGAERLAYRRVLNGRGDDVAAARPADRGDTKEGEVIGLAAATGKNHLVRVGAKQCCKLLAHRAVRSRRSAPAPHRHRRTEGRGSR